MKLPGRHRRPPLGLAPKAVVPAPSSAGFWAARAGLVVVLAGFLGIAYSPARASVTVNLAGSLFGDNAISSWNGSFSNATMDSRPDILPFNGPGVGATRYTGNNPVNLLGSGNVLAAIYTRVTGNGSMAVTASGGTTSAFGAAFTNYSAQTFASGSRLPVAGLTGTLGSSLSLPSGLALTAGTPIYADFSGYVMNYNKPADFWYESANHITHQVYENGSMDFYYRDGGGLYRPLASYTNSSIAMATDYVNNTSTAIWSGTSTAVNNVILPASINITNFFGTLNKSGIITAQRDTTPYLGFFGNYNTTFSVTFDEAGASLAPEPGRALLLAMGLGLCLLRRRRATR